MNDNLELKKQLELAAIVLKDLSKSLLNQTQTINKTIDESTKKTERFKTSMVSSLDTFHMRLREVFDEYPEKAIRTIQSEWKRFQKSVPNFDTKNAEQLEENIKVYHDKLSTYLKSSVEALDTLQAKQLRQKQEALSAKIEESWFFNPLGRFKEEMQKKISGGASSILKKLSFGKKDSVMGILAEAVGLPADVINVQQSTRRKQAMIGDPEKQKEYKIKLLKTAMPDKSEEELMKLYEAMSKSDIDFKEVASSFVRKPMSEEETKELLKESGFDESAINNPEFVNPVQEANLTRKEDIAKLKTNFNEITEEMITNNGGAELSDEELSSAFNLAVERTQSEVENVSTSSVVDAILGIKEKVEDISEDTSEMTEETKEKEDADVYLENLRKRGQVEKSPIMNTIIEEGEAAEGGTISDLLGTLISGGIGGLISSFITGTLLPMITTAFTAYIIPGIIAFFTSTPMLMAAAGAIGWGIGELLNMVGAWFFGSDTKFQEFILNNIPIALLAKQFGLLSTETDRLAHEKKLEREQIEQLRLEKNKSRADKGELRLRQQMLSQMNVKVSDEEREKLYNMSDAEFQQYVRKNYGQSWFGGDTSKYTKAFDVYLKTKYKMLNTNKSQPQVVEQQKNVTVESTKTDEIREQVQKDIEIQKKIIENKNLQQSASGSKSTEVEQINKLNEINETLKKINDKPVSQTHILKKNSLTPMTDRRNLNNLPNFYF